MPLINQFSIQQHKVAIWNTTENVDFFLNFVPLYKNIYNNNEKRRLEYLSSRYLLQFIKPDFPYSEIIVENNKPTLNRNDIFFSISHSKNYSSAIISPQNVGIDIQVFTNKIFSVIPKFLNEKEIDFFDVKCNITLTILWTIKEAAYKLLSLRLKNYAQQLNIEKTYISLQKDNFKSIYIDLSLENTIKRIKTNYYINNNFVICYSSL